MKRDVKSWVGKCMPNMSTSKSRIPEAIWIAATIRNTRVEVGTYNYGLRDKTSENPKRA
jgi:hypothetical protein